MPTLQPHRNILTDLIAELERERQQAKRRADVHDDTTIDGLLQIARDRGIQDTLSNATGRLRNIAGASLGRLIDDDTEGDAYVLALDAIDGFAVGCGHAHYVNEAFARRAVEAILGGLTIAGTRTARGGAVLEELGR